MRKGGTPSYAVVSCQLTHATKLFKLKNTQKSPFWHFWARKSRNCDVIAKNGQRHRVRHQKIFRTTQFKSKVSLVLLSYLSLKMPKNRYFGTFRLGNLKIVT